ncbi:hypothetical protein K3152_00850 [Qipengyuania sp. 1NDH17]|uniref:HTH luxR-type domain-containing protein n=1 Tax=Qipengyuania polymorpha TaxID=2867234 RepID=A0ABS7IU15_9SPHN|nr:hypothetical protein [Qipengyuania polymorpha]MBX7456785.1 hypothetical protein [Qipengyuania polymorpha]
MGVYQWDALLQDLAEWVGGSKAMLLGAEEAGPYRHSATWNLAPEPLASYNNYYNRFDPRRKFALFTPVHHCQLGQQYVANDTIEGTEYFDAINVRGDVKDSVHGVIASDREIGRRTISIQRGFREEFFGQAEAARLAAVLPMLEAAMRDSIRFSRSLAGQMSGEGYCYLVVDPARRVVFSDADEGGQLSAGNSLSLLGGQLTSGDERIDMAIERAIRSAIGGTALHLDIAGLELSFSRVPGSLGWLADDDHCFLAIVPKPDLTQTRTDLFAIAHGFSAREKEILSVLLGEDDLRNAAEKAGLTYETLRWHVKNMQQKSGIQRRDAMLAAAREGKLD